MDNTLIIIALGAVISVISVVAMASHRESPRGDVQRGRLLWYNDAKGFGFIDDDKGESHFVTFQALEANGLRYIEPNTPVVFRILTTNPKLVSGVQLAAEFESQGLREYTPETPLYDRPDKQKGTGARAVRFSFAFELLKSSLSGEDEVPSEAELRALDGVRHDDDPEDPIIDDVLKDLPFEGLRTDGIVLRYNAKTGQVEWTTTFWTTSELKEGQVEFLQEYTEVMWTEAQGEHFHQLVLTKRFQLIRKHRAEPLGSRVELLP
jgi:cold shock protein